MRAIVIIHAGERLIIFNNRLSGSLCPGLLRLLLRCYYVYHKGDDVSPGLNLLTETFRSGTRRRNTVDQRQTKVFRVFAGVRKVN